MPTIKQSHIGFPPPLLGERPLRLGVLYAQDGLLALNKPIGYLAEAYPWFTGMPNIVAAIKQQHKEGKPELERLGIKSIHSLYNMEPEMSGILLLVTNAQAREKWRNTYGSLQLEFSFRIQVTKNNIKDKELCCNLPVAQHLQKKQAFISHTTGKKCETVFCRVSDSEWSAHTHYLRPHQIRIHAYELGLPLVGETLYVGEKTDRAVDARGRQTRISKPPSLRIQLQQVRAEDLVLSYH